MNNTGFILSLAYPDTIVSHSEEWYIPYLKYLGVGSKTHVRAGHAALVLIEKTTGIMEYHDFGRYITPEPNGRVRGKTTDNELEFPLVAEIKEDTITNLVAILKYLATHPKLTHGEGKLVASVCSQVDYQKARTHITGMQNRHFIRYAAFVKDGCNCARFVVDTLIASVTSERQKKKLEGSKWFTPSTIGTVIIADTEKYVYEVSEQGEISNFKGSQNTENVRCFLDRLKGYNPSLVGTMQAKPLEVVHENAQWLSGIAAGAWFELHKTEVVSEYIYKRVSPYGNIDVNDVFVISETTFDFHNEFEFVHYSNCSFFHVKQKDTIYRFDRKSS
jgi:hypothetical protein